MTTSKSQMDCAHLANHLILFCESLKIYYATPCQQWWFGNSTPKHPLHWVYTWQHFDQLFNQDSNFSHKKSPPVLMIRAVMLLPNPAASEMEEISTNLFEGIGSPRNVMYIYMYNRQTLCMPSLCSYKLLYKHGKLHIQHSRELRWGHEVIITCFERRWRWPKIDTFSPSSSHNSNCLQSP